MVLDVRDYGDLLTVNKINQLIDRVHQENTIALPDSYAKVTVEITKLFITHRQMMQLFVNRGKFRRNHNGINVHVMEDTDQSRANTHRPLVEPEDTDIPI